MDILPKVIGAVTNEYLSNKDFSNFLNFAKFIDIPEGCITYINTVEQPMINVTIEGEQLVTVPISLLFNDCPEFAEFYNVGTLDSIYNTEVIAAFVVYYILSDWLEVEDEEKKTLEPLAKILVKFIKPGSPNSDKLLAELS